MIGKGAVQNLNIGNLIFSDDFYIGTGGTTRGWRLDKKGKLTGRDIEILDANGNLVFHVDTGLDFAHITGDTAPAPNATSNEIIYWSYSANGDSQPEGGLGDLWIDLDDNQLYTHDGLGWVAGKSGESAIYVIINSDNSGFAFKNNAGTSKILSVTVYDMETGGTVAPSAYQWKKNGVNIATTATIIVSATDVTDGGSEQYSCEVTV
jgi:hypothetical protein